MTIAVAVSLLAHALLLLLSLWLPLPLSETEAASPEETVLRFDFARPAERTLLQEPPAGDLPDEPRPSATPVAPTPPVPDRVQTPPPSPTPAPAVEEPSREAAAGSAGDPAGDDSPESALPRDEAGDVGGDTARRGDLAEREQGFDVGRALESFGRALSSRPVTEPNVVAPGVDGASSEFRPELSELPSTGFGVGNLVFETKDFDWYDYARQIYVAIWRAWHQRLYMTTDEFEKVAHATGDWYLNDQVAVRFTIERSGRVTGIAVELPSGWVPLDLSATDALGEVILPPLPEAFPKASETVHARFIAIGEVRALRPHLRRYKQAGYF